MINYKEITLSVVLSFIPIIVWKILFQYSCAALIFPAMLMLLLFYGIYQKKTIKQRYAYRFYFSDNTLLFRIFTKKFFVILWSLISAIIISLFFAFSVINFKIADFIIFGIDGIFLLLLFEFLNRTDIFNKDHKSVIIKSIVVNINISVMVLIYIIIQLYSPAPDYIAPSLEQTVVNASANVASTCDIINIIAKLNVEIEAIKWWFMIDSTTFIKKIITSLSSHG